MFRLAALALVPMLLLVAELGLRAVEPPQPSLDLPQGWSGDARIVSTGSRQLPLERYSADDGSARIRTTKDMVDSRFMHPVDYNLERPEGVLRVFCFGGSATLGVPVEATPELTFPGQLQALLAAAGVQAEVINLGGASFGSDRVVELMAQAVEHQPSVLVVYSANNEFFEYALALHERNADRGDAAFERRSGSRLVRGLWRLSDRVKGRDAALPSPDALEQRQQALVRTAVEIELARDPGSAPQADGEGFRRRDTPYRDVVSRYAANLERMAALARDVAPLVLVVVPANLAQEPFQAVHDPSMSERQIAAWERSVGQAQVLLEGGDAQAAVALLDTAIQQDPIHARAHWLRGKAWLELGDQRQASRDLHAALELDVAPGRPVTAQAEAVRSRADPPRVLVVDPTLNFEAVGLASGGQGHFHDACHLVPEGYGLLARHVARALEGAGLTAATY